jgi:hypothetical protein
MRTTWFALTAWSQESASRTRLSPQPEIACELLDKLSLAQCGRDCELSIDRDVALAWADPDLGLERVSTPVALVILGRLLSCEDTALKIRAVLASIPLIPGSLEARWELIPPVVRKEPGWIWLQHLGLCEHHDGIIRCVPELRPYLLDSTYVARPMTQAELEERLKAQSECAALAETYVVRVEQDRLRKSGHDELAEGVYQISRDDVTAGYDVHSFEVDGQRRYIEVKASVGPRRHFFLSVNELTKGRQYGESYWLAWIGFAERLPDGPVDMAWFRNPMATLDLDGGPWEMNADGFVIVRRGDDSLFRTTLN